MSNFVCLGAFGGRIDQMLRSINSLKWIESLPEAQGLDLFLVDDFSVMAMLKKGLTVLYPGESLESRVGTGLVPLGCKEA